MTESDLAKIKFRCVSHLAMEHEHVIHYESVDYVPQFHVSIHTPVLKNGICGKTFGRQRKRYIFLCKVYKSKKKLLEAITAFEEECKSKLERQ